VGHRTSSVKGTYKGKSATVVVDYETLAKGGYGDPKDDKALQDVYAKLQELAAECGADKDKVFVRWSHQKRWFITQLSYMYKNRENDPAMVDFVDEVRLTASVEFVDH